MYPCETIYNEKWNFKSSEILREVKLRQPKVNSVACIHHFLIHTSKQYVH